MVRNRQKHILTNLPNVKGREALEVHQACNTPWLLCSLLNRVLGRTFRIMEAQLRHCEYLALTELFHPRIHPLKLFFPFCCEYFSVKSGQAFAETGLLLLDAGQSLVNIQIFVEYFLVVKPNKHFVKVILEGLGIVMPLQIALHFLKDLILGFGRLQVCEAIGQLSELVIDFDIIVPEAVIHVLFELLNTSK